MDQAEFFRFTIQTLERLAIPYLVVGSAASSIYGDPRMTRDIDIVIDPTMDQIQQLCAAFPSDDFYVSVEAARDALRARTQFNVIRSDSSDKVDFMIAGLDAWGRSQVSRGKRVALLPGLQGTAGAPEDVIISKMSYYREGGSEKHLRDIASMLRVAVVPIDRQYIEKWAAELGLADIWRDVLKQLN